jgi:hypothetical protein
MRFSERIGKRNPRVEIQINSMDEELKNSLWNVISISIISPLKQRDWKYQSSYETLIDSIWFSFFKEPLDNIPARTSQIASEIRSRFFNWDYLDVYDFLDFLSTMTNEFDTEEFIYSCDFILKRELAGYRFVNGKLAPITSEEEINEIERAIDSTSDNGLKGVNIHLTEALNKLSDKKNPDYRNSIKESISAVESLCQQITNDPKAELGKALKVLKDKFPIHGALEKGFKSIYGYTSDGDGIRHAMMEESNLDQEDALFMVISCSAFINYLIAKAIKSDIIIK